MELSPEAIAATIAALKQRIPVVYLGGTVSTPWRDELIPLLKVQWGNPTTGFDPASADECDYLLHVFTPATLDAISTAALVEDSNKRPLKTILCVLENDNDSYLAAIAKLVRGNGAKVCTSLQEVADYVNNTSLVPTDDGVVLKYIMDDLQRIKSEILLHLSLPVITFPFRPANFPKDNREIGSFNLICPDCGSPLGDLRGQIVEKFNTIDCQINGFCLMCQGTKFNHLRWHKDGHWTTKTVDGWMGLTFDPPTFREQIMEKLKELLNLFRSK